MIRPARLRPVKASFAAGLAALTAVAAAAQDDHDRLRAALDTLVASYPNALADHDDKVLRWRDGTAMPLRAESDSAAPKSDSVAPKTLAQLLRDASITDQLRIPYPRGELHTPPAVDADPGRFRNAAFFAKMYGDCHKGEVTPHLASLPWLPKTWGKPIRITAVNGVDAQLRAVSAEIDALPESVKRAAYPIAGTYNCRTVADTGQPSPHSYGIAIDLNTAVADYWYWRPHHSAIAYRNRIPAAIVAIFEKHGFIWGGKWYHYDTMHFEFRPELLVSPAK